MYAVLKQYNVLTCRDLQIQSCFILPYPIFTLLALLPRTCTRLHVYPVVYLIRLSVPYQYPICIISMTCTILYLYLVQYQNPWSYTLPTICTILYLYPVPYPIHAVPVVYLHLTHNLYHTVFVPYTISYLYANLQACTILYLYPAPYPIQTPICSPAPYPIRTLPVPYPHFTHNLNHTLTPCVHYP